MKLTPVYFYCYLSLLSCLKLHTNHQSNKIKQGQWDAGCCNQALCTPNNIFNMRDGAQIVTVITTTSVEEAQSTCERTCAQITRLVKSKRRRATEFELFTDALTPEACVQWAVEGITLEGCADMSNYDASMMHTVSLEDHEMNSWNATLLHTQEWMTGRFLSVCAQDFAVDDENAPLVCDMAAPAPALEAAFLQKEAGCGQAFCLRLTDMILTDKHLLRAHGDPMMTNVVGKQFDVRATGNFKFLELSDTSNTSLLSVHATIEKAGRSSGQHAKFSKCATYVTSLNISGKWMNDSIRVQVDRSSKRNLGNIDDVLQVYADGKWHHGSTREKKISSSKMQAQIAQDKVIFKVQDIEMLVSLHFHHSRAGRRILPDYFAFLDFDVKGVKSLENSNIHIGGLLGHDDHSLFTIPPPECKTSEAFNFFNEGDQHAEESGLLSTCKIE